MLTIIDSMLLNLQRRSLRSRLEELDDRLLADIGLTRAELSRRNFGKKPR